VAANQKASGEPRKRAQLRHPRTETLFSLASACFCKGDWQHAIRMLHHRAGAQYTFPPIRAGDELLDIEIARIRDPNFRSPSMCPMKSLKNVLASDKSGVS
jgi:hypothetical protein